ncbi:MAG TPA: SulP family inorganic anion transporter [Pirellulaceae bacterium]|nr:SulP family inorganic anion transporter [Pirellulaceae bacterium]
MPTPQNQPESQPSLADFPRDFLASIVVFLVALPLCMGIAIASGVPVAAGLITGIVGGLVVASLAGAPLQVSGPAAGLTVLVFELVHEHGLAALGIAVLLCGVIQFVAGLCKLGQWFRAVSPTVIHAMLSGIGILIVGGQLHVMVDDKPRENGLRNLLTIPEAVVKGIPWPRWTSLEDHRARTALLKQFGQLHAAQSDLKSEVEAHVSQHGSSELHQRQLESHRDLAQRQTDLAERFSVLAREIPTGEILLHAPQEREALLASIAAAEAKIRAAVIALEMRQADHVRSAQAEAEDAIGTILPQLKNHDWAAKVGLLTIAIIVLWSAIPFRRLKMIPASLVAVVVATSVSAALALPVLYVEIPERISDGIMFPSLAIFNDVSAWELIKTGLMLAVIASAETLLCATAVDKMHNGPRTKYDQELMAQGVGNTLCGLLGALPMTGVIVRSAANVQAGAKTKWSAFLHGVWLLVFVVALAGVLRMIPVACLAGILVYTGYRLIDWRSLVRLWKEDKVEALIFVATVGLIVGEDLLTGVIAGIVLSAIKLLVTFSHLEVQLAPDGGKPGHERVTLHVSGAATFLRLPILAAKLEEVPQGAELHVDFEHLNYIDHSCLELLMTWAKQHESSGGRLVIDWGQLHARFKEQRKGSRRPRHPTAVEGAV